MHSQIARAEQLPEEARRRRKAPIDAPEPDEALQSAEPGLARSADVLALQRTAGNSAVARLLQTYPAPAEPAVQRQGSEHPFQLTMPTLGSNLFPAPTLGGPELELDPSISAQMRVIDALTRLLDPAVLHPALESLEPSALPLASLPALPSSAPLVPAGAGPSTPREAEAGDVLSAIMAVPAIDSAITALQTQAVDRVRRDWGRLSTGERALTIAVSTLVAGGALAGAAADPEARAFLLDQLNGRVIPVPGVTGLGVELNTQRNGIMVGLHLDIGALLPAWMGFGPSSPSAIGGPPSP